MVPGTEEVRVTAAEGVPEQVFCCVLAFVKEGTGFTVTFNVAAELEPQALEATTETTPVPDVVQLALIPVVFCPEVIDPPAPDTTHVYPLAPATGVIE